MRNSKFISFLSILSVISSNFVFAAGSNGQSQQIVNNLAGPSSSSGSKSTSASGSMISSAMKGSANTPKFIKATFLDKSCDSQKLKSYLTLSDDQLFDLAINRKLGRCAISDHRNTPVGVCDFYVTSSVVGSLGHTGWPKNPASGDSTGCLYAKDLDKNLSIPGNQHKGGSDICFMSTSIAGYSCDPTSYKKNAAVALRDAISKDACCPKIAAPVTTCVNPYLNDKSLSDAALIAKAKNGQLGACVYQDVFGPPANTSYPFACDSYVKTGIIVHQNGNNYNGFPFPGDGNPEPSSGCVYSPNWGDSTEACYYQDTARYCTSNHIVNTANALRDAIDETACGCVNVTVPNAPLLDEKSTLDGTSINK